ncbi:STAS-like domain-containing protein [Mycobacterium sp. HNNTM2301]|uniref:STAS-like domain-containing protein n=1 Tax=Mycobacterium hainanense TaxID=3289775 RepID=UPI0035A66858
MSKHIKVFDATGSFAENKDAAAKIREKSLMPTLTKSGYDVELDFADVEYATQSFIHALIAKVIRTNVEWLDRITFSNCTEAVQGIIEIVVDYAQETD